MTQIDDLRKAILEEGRLTKEEFDGSFVVILR